MKHILKKLYVSLIAVCLISSSSFAVPVAARGMSSARLNSAKITRPLLFEVESSQSAQSEAGLSQTAQSEAGLSQTAQSEAELSQTAQSEAGFSQTAQSEAGLPQTASTAAESSKPAQPEAAKADSTPLMASAKEQTAFFESVKIDGVKISVRAAAGTFPAGATLSVEKISQRTQLTVDEAIEKERTEGANVVASYSFDITVKDVDGNELQPADGHEVEVKFKLAEVEDQNLDTSVFHIEEERGKLNAASLDVTVSDNTAVVIADSFSIYTVEFTYNDRQYVMKGGEVLPLRDILDEIELYGDVTAVEVSDSTLFEAYQQYGDWYVKSNMPFLTDEWMRVTIAGIEYEIKVTDALPAYGAPGTVWLDQITQGTDGKNFAKDAPLSSIQIDPDILLDLNKAEFQKLTSDPGLITLPAEELYGLNGNKGDDKAGIFASYDTDQPGAYTPTLSKTDDNLISGDLFSFTYRDAAILEDGSKGDVVLTYSNLHITLQNNTTAYNGTYYIASGNMLRVGNTRFDSNNRNGIQIDVNIHVVDKEGNLVPGTFAFPMTDIDVTREGNANFSKIYNASLHNNYSEQVAVKSGYVGGIYIPDYEGIDEEDALRAIELDPENPEKTKNYAKVANRGYKTGIEIYQYEEDGEQKEAVRFVGIGKGDDDPGTYYSGFYTIADNTSGGINITAWQAGSRTAPVRTNLLNGKLSIQHKIQSSTTEGGTIQTTIDGNLDGTLNDGSALIGPATVLVLDGKTVKYTMTPDKGFYCNEIYIGDETDASKNKTSIPRVDLEKLISGELSEITVTLNEGGYTETISKLLESQVDERTGTLTYDSGNGAFIFEFPNNNYDHRIHVDWDWKPIYDLEVKKIVKGTQSSIYQYFPFTIQITIPDGADTRMCALDTEATDYDTDDVVKSSIYYKSTDVVNQPTTLSDFIPEPGQSKEVTVWLRHGQSVKLLNLPDGTTYSITENPGDYTETVISKATLRNNMESSGSGYRSSIKTAGTFTRELIRKCEPDPSGTTGQYIRSGTKTFYQKVDESYSGTRYDYDESRGEFWESTDDSGAYGKVEIAMYEEIDPSTYSGDEQKYIMTSSYWLYEKSHTITHINEKDAPVPTSVSLVLLPAISCVMIGCGGIGGVFLGRRRDDDE